MFVLTTSLFVFLHAIALSNALPMPYYARTLVARRPTVGQALTMSKTVNNAAAGTFTATGGDVALTVGDRINEGTAGIVFKVNCGSNAACQELGPVVLKFYKDNDQVAPEQQHLAKINELKAVSTGTGDQLTLMKGFTGKSLSETDAYLKLTEKVTDKTQLDLKAIETLVTGAADLAVKNGLEYLNQHQIIHNDINDGNVLFTESNGLITGAQLIDWDKATIVTPAEVAGSQKEVTKQTLAFERLVDGPKFEKKNADAAKKPVKKPLPRPAAAAAGSGSAKPAAAAAAPAAAKPVAPAAGPAVPAAAPITPPAAARPVAVPRPAAQAGSVPPPSAGRPAVPAAAPDNRRP